MHCIFRMDRNGSLCKRLSCKRTVAFSGLEIPSRLCPRAHAQDLKKYKKMKEARKKRGEDVSDSAEDA